MAGKEKEVVLEDEGVVTIDVSDNPDLAAESGAEEGEAEAQSEAKKLERIRLSEQKPVKTPAVDEATQALTAAKKDAEDQAKARQAAEATAAAERSRREQAEAAARRAQAAADDARTSAESAQITLVERGIESAQGEVTAYEGQLADAFEKGDFKAAAALQTKLSSATARLDRLTTEKDQLESAPKKTTEGRVEALNASPVETYLSGFSPAAQTWLRAHPECVPAAVGGNPQSNAKMMQGHYAALAASFAPDTPDYFRVIEEHTGHRQPVSKAADVTQAGAEDTEEIVETKSPPKPKPKAQPAAPPSREPMAASGKPTQRTVTLSKDEQDMAKLSFPHLKPAEAYAQYARNKVELEAEGKLGRTTH